MKVYIFVAHDDSASVGIIVRPFLDKASAEAQRNGDRREEVRTFEISDATIRRKLPPTPGTSTTGGDFTDLLFDSFFGNGKKGKGQ